MGMYYQLIAVSQGDIDNFKRQPDNLEQLMLGGGGVSLEKAWHGLHFALAGTSWGGELPLSFLLAGGEPLEEVDTGYGPPRLLSPADVVEIANALGAITDQEFDQRFDVEQMAAEQVYPPIWDEPRADLVGEYLHYFGELREFVRNAARERMGLLAFIG